MSAKNKKDFSSKFIRDPLYGFIGLSELELKIINTKVFSRLRDIKQLGHEFLVYPSAIHTRYEHSLGVVHLANMISDQLNFNSEEKEIIRLAGLLHDIGHGPFSHLFELVLKEINTPEIDHEKISMMFIKEDLEIQEILGADKIEKIIQLLDHKPIEGWDASKSTLATDIISSDLDVDKMDYLRRDSYHIGVNYGQFDLHRLVHTLTSTDNPKDNHIAVKFKGMESVESYRLGRYLMHAQVYKHHTRLIADQMFVKALKLSIKDKIIEEEKLKTDTDLNKEHKEFLKYYIQLDDRSLYDMIINKKLDSDAAKILKKIRQRKLLKRICQISPEDDIRDAIIRNKILKKDELEKIQKDLIKVTKLNEYEIFIHDSKIPVGLYKNRIMIMRDGIPESIDKLSPISATESERNMLYIFGPDNKNVRDRITEYMESEYRIKSSTY